MAQDGRSHSARLRRQIFTTLRLGAPLTALGLAACYGALWLGLNAQGWLILGCGLIVVVAGGALMLLAIGTTVLFVDAAVRGWFRRRRGPSSVKRAAGSVSSPVAVSEPPVSPPEPAAAPNERGPLVF